MAARRCGAAAAAAATLLAARCPVHTHGDECGPLSDVAPDQTGAFEFARVVCRLALFLAAARARLGSRKIPPCLKISETTCLVMPKLSPVVDYIHNVLASTSSKKLL